MMIIIMVLIVFLGEITCALIPQADCGPAGTKSLIVNNLLTSNAQSLQENLKPRPLLY